MARPAPITTPPTATYTVLRAICMNGERIEVGSPVEMTPLQYAEAHNAGKVGPYVAPAPDQAPAPKASKKQKADEPAAPTAPAAAAPEEPTP